jgi:hypothetical protein
MPRYCLTTCMIFGLLGPLSLPAPAAGFDLLGWLKGDHRSHTAEYLGIAEPAAALVPGPQPLPRPQALGTGYGSGPGVSSCNWGYFGAPYRPVDFCHKGYYGDCLWWCYRRP